MCGSQVNKTEKTDHRERTPVYAKDTGPLARTGPEKELVQ